MAVVLDSMYALLSGQLAILAKSNPNSRFAGILSGSLFIGAGAALAAVGRE